MPKPMTESERMARHEQVIRDSFRSQQQGLRDWIRMLIALGEDEKDISALLGSFASDVDSNRRDVEARRWRG
jgi:hypothetical protein